VSKTHYSMLIAYQNKKTPTMFDKCDGQHSWNSRLIKLVIS